MFNKGILFVVFCAMAFPVIANTDVNAETSVQLPSQGTGITYISGFSFYNKPVTYAKINGLAILEGDIILGTIEEAESWKASYETNILQGISPRSIIITGERFRWINNLIPFQFGANVPNFIRNTVLRAMNHWRDNTTIDFVERTTANAADFPDFVTIVSDADTCQSSVGRRGGEQFSNIAATCSFGSTVHELGHVVGLWHEQSRADRDNFVIIHWENIQRDDPNTPENEDRIHNFDQRINDGDDVGVYDYGSIMHYGELYFSANGFPTIETINPPGAAIGQRNGLSNLAIASVLQNYPEFLPVAQLDKNTYSIFLGNSVLFDGRHSFDPNGDNLTYFWDLGDGTTRNSNLATFEHIYTNRGKYNVSLTVTDPDGNSSTDTATSYVYGTEIFVPALYILL